MTTILNPQTDSDVDSAVIRAELQALQDQIDGITGDVVGPSSSTDNAIALFDSTTGKVIQNSGVKIGGVSGNTIIVGEGGVAGVAGVPTDFNFKGINSTDDVGGNNYFSAGDALGGDKAGGAVIVRGGSGHGNQAGGAAYLRGREGGATGAGGAAIVQGGAGGATSGQGGAAYLVGGAGTNGNANGGALLLAPGAKNGSGAHGQFTLYEYYGASYYANLDLSLIAYSNKTFTFPNRTGAFSITSEHDIEDDTAILFVPPYQYGTLIISMQTDNGGAYGGIVNYTAEWTGQAYTTKWAGGANLNVTTGVLAGTTGTDAKVTVSTHTDGNIYVENRTGSTRKFIITLV